MNRIIAGICLLCLCLSACQPTSSAPTEHVVTPSIEATISQPTERPEPTATPAPTALPGKVVIPIESMQEGIPWLSEYDPNNAPGLYFIGFNTQAAPFNNPLVRQALTAAIDRRSILELGKRVLQNSRNSSGFRFATALTPPEVLGRDLEGEIGIDFNPDLAKSLLAEAGYSDPSLFPKSFFRVGYGGSVSPGAWTQIGNEIISMWEANLGITNIELEVVDYSNGYFEGFADDPPAIFYEGWYAGSLDPSEFLKGVFADPYNYTKFSNLEYNDLIQEAETVTDPLKRQELYIQAERIILETQVPLIPLFYISHSE